MMKIGVQYSYWIVIILVSYCSSFKTPKLMGSLIKEHTVPNYKYDTIYMEQDLDHFTFQKNPQQYKQRLLINKDHWSTGGPIFFYTGNEGDIELFAENTGFMFDIAPKFNACIVFAEHRYYGKSLPFGNQSFSSWEKTQYLDVNQVLADYANNILMLKSEYPEGRDVPVIAFGGSYGGMLAAWLRMKYPSLVQGSIAASAPVWMFPGMNVTRCSGPYEIITRVFNDISSSCKDKVKQSWGDINQLGGSTKGRAQLQDLFKTCKPFNSSGDVMMLSMWLESMYFDMAMVNYPYPTSFLAPLPAWPVREFCARADKLSDTLEGIAAASQVYSNYTGTSKCLDLDSDPAGGLGMQAWTFQACLEIILPICSKAKFDMFPEQGWDLKSYVAACEKQWSSKAKPYWLKHSFGGVDGFNFFDASQILFSDGYLDPWSAGGVEQIDEPVCRFDCPKVFIKDGAHHLDLRGANENDPASVMEARDVEIAAISRWISQHRDYKLEL